MQIITDTQVIPKQICPVRQEPVLFKGYAKAWPAIEQWTWDYLKQLADNRQVKLVVGDRESGQAQFTQMALSQYIDILADPDNCQDKRQLYLKEFDLLTEFPQLQRDIRCEAFFPDNMTAYQHAWIGVKGAATGLHHDIFDNLFTQIRGRKTFLLLAYDQISPHDRSDKFDYFARLAKLDLFAENNQARRVKPMTVEVEAGDALYIPKGWWHQVKSSDPTISISGFMATRWQRWTAGTWEDLRYFAHNRGWYKKHHCTCHVS
jgi:lysine-specific demethylase 8